MTNQSETDLATTLAQEVVKQIPVRDIYADGLSSPIKQSGELVTDIIKTFRLALAPIQYLSTQQDRFRRFIEGAAQRVPEEQRVSPAPQILGPVIEALRYEPEGTISDEAFSRLLSKAFDRERLDQAHPAFPHIIRSLSSDEIALVKSLMSKNIRFIVGHSNRNDQFKQPDTTKFGHIFESIRYPEQALVYANHIESLGIVNTLLGEFDGNTDPEGFFPVFWTLELSEFGKLFAKAVLA